MSRLADLYRELRQRRVIRTAVVYIALVWGALQAVELLDDAGFMTEHQVQWLILAALIGFPLILILSWFFETPWRNRKGLSVLGDIVIILSVVIGVALLAWQHYFRSISRPALAILTIEATDTKADTPALGNYLGDRLRMVIATRKEIRVTEPASARHPSLKDRSMREKSDALGADYMLAGTINQTGGQVHVDLQLYDANGELIWTDRFEDRMLDQAQLQSAILNNLWEQLPLPPETLAGTREIISQCEYPTDADAIRALFHDMTDGNFESRIQELTTLIERFEDNGLLHLARAELFFRQLETVAPFRRPVISNLALQDIQQLEYSCPNHPQASYTRLINSLVFEGRDVDIPSLLDRHPNSSNLRLKAAQALLERGEAVYASKLAFEAWQLDPLSEPAICLYHNTLRAADDDSADRLGKFHTRHLPGFDPACR